MARAEFDSLKAALTGRYTLERKLGQGGMAAVYLAHDEKHDRKVAVKVLRPELAAVVGATRFLQEIKVTASLQHPHILPLFDSGEVDGFLFYVMPYVEGESLRDRLRRERTLDAREVARILRDVADALSHAHSHGVVHRDIKPDNVMISGRHATVMDFGVARAVTEAADEASLTTTGIAVGSPTYMAPEQAVADPLTDHRADIYALGILGYELLTGAPPFADRSPQQALAAHVTETPAPMSQTRQDIPVALASVVMRALAKSPSDRWQHAEEIVNALETLETPGGTTRVRIGSRHRRRWAVGAVAAIVTIVAIVFGLTQRPPRSADGVSPTSVVVFPFTVRGGSEFRYLREGMVNLLATSMDGAGDLRSVDPRAVMALVNRDQLEIIEPVRGARIARELGAGLYVLGDLVQAGDQIRLDAALYDARAEPQQLAYGTVDGPESELLAMVDQVATQLLASAAAPGSRVTQVAAVTTASLPALKSYLEGEAEFRAGQFGPAVDAFQAAIAADSQFALAFFRLSIAAEWAIQPALARRAAEGAVRNADRLSDRDRRLLEALLTARRGESVRAEQMFRAIVEVWPREVDAWFQLGEVQFHYSPLQGRSFQRSREVFERILDFEPDHVVSLVHLQRMAARAGDTVAVDSLGRRIVELNPQGDRALEAKVLRAVVASDSAALRGILSVLRQAPEIQVPQGIFVAFMWTDEFSDVQSLFETETLASRSDELRALGHVHLAHLHALRGRRSAARAELQEAANIDEALGLLYLTLFALHPFVPSTNDELGVLRNRLLAWDAEQVPPNRIPSAHFSIHNGLHPALRRYLLGMIHVQLGDLATARVFAAELDRGGGEDDTRDLVTWFARSIESAAAAAEGDLSTALQILDQEVEQFGNYEPGLFSPIYARSLERFMRAMLLERVERDIDAARVYRSFEDWSFFDKPYTAPAALLAARLAARDGRPVDARQHYERFLFLWSEADSVFYPLLNEARSALQALASK